MKALSHDSSVPHGVRCDKRDSQRRRGLLNRMATNVESPLEDNGRSTLVKRILLGKIGPCGASTWGLAISA